MGWEMVVGCNKGKKNFNIERFKNKNNKENVVLSNVNIVKTIIFKSKIFRVN